MYKGKEKCGKSVVLKLKMMCRHFFTFGTLFNDSISWSVDDVSVWLNKIP